MSDTELLIQEKLFYERFYALHNDPLLLDIFNKFGIRVFRRSSVLEGFDAFLVKNRFNGKCCVEIGTCKGLTAIVLSRYFEKVVTIDVVRDPEKEDIANYFGIKNIAFVDVKDNEQKAKVIRSLQFDAAYVDGDHTNDTEADFELVKRCGRVLFHEYWPAQPPVWNLVNRLFKSDQVITKGKLALWTSPNG